MSPSARRVVGSAVIDRFEWQDAVEAAAPVAPAPLFRPRERTTGSTARAFSLPGLSAERTAALEQEAFNKGYADGMRAAEAASAARLDERLGRLATAIQEVGSLRAGIMRETERDLVRLAIAMAQRIVRRHIDIDPSRLVAIAREAAARLGSRVAATIHLNPADHARIAPDSSGAIELHVDPEIPPGGVQVRSAFGTIDAGVDAQIRELTRALLGDASEEAAGDGDAAR